MQTYDLSFDLSLNYCSSVTVGYAYRVPPGTRGTCFYDCMIIINTRTDISLEAVAYNFLFSSICGTEIQKRIPCSCIHSFFIPVDLVSLINNNNIHINIINNGFYNLHLDPAWDQRHEARSPHQLLDCMAR